MDFKVPQRTLGIIMTFASSTLKVIPFLGTGSRCPASIPQYGSGGQHSHILPFAFPLKYSLLWTIAKVKLAKAYAATSTANAVWSSHGTPTPQSTKPKCAAVGGPKMQKAWRSGVGQQKNLRIRIESGVLLSNWQPNATSNGITKIAAINGKKKILPFL